MDTAPYSVTPHSQSSSPTETVTTWVTALQRPRRLGMLAIIALRLEKGVVKVAHRPPLVHRVEAWPPLGSSGSTAGCHGRQPFFISRHLGSELRRIGILAAGRQPLAILLR